MHVHLMKRFQSEPNVQQHLCLADECVRPQKYARLVMLVKVLKGTCGKQIYSKELDIRQTGCRTCSMSGASCGRKLA